MYVCPYGMLVKWKVKKKKKKMHFLNMKKTNFNLYDNDGNNNIVIIMMMMMTMIILMDIMVVDVLNA